MTAQAQVGLAGLGVMGANLAMNMEDHGFSMAVWNRGADALDQFMAKVKGMVLLLRNCAVRPCHTPR